MNELNSKAFTIYLNPQIIGGLAVKGVGTTEILILYISTFLTL